MCVTATDGRRGALLHLLGISLPSVGGERAARRAIFGQSTRSLVEFASATFIVARRLSPDEIAEAKQRSANHAKMCQQAGGRGRACRKELHISSSCQRLTTMANLTNAIPQVCQPHSCWWNRFDPPLTDLADLGLGAP